MESKNIYVTFASWEDRFLLGLEQGIDRERPLTVISYYLEEYRERTNENRRLSRELCAKNNIELIENSLLNSNPRNNWFIFDRDIKTQRNTYSYSTLDITTMPRENIFTLLWFMSLNKYNIKYIYHRPEKYGDWLSRDPDKPRLIYKMSGISNMGSRTALLILAGYDGERIQQLIRYYEPSLIIVGLQKGDSDSANDLKMKSVQESFREHDNVEFFELDSYSEKHGEDQIEQQIKKLIGKYNIVASSLGPKLSAVSLFEIQRRHQEVSLSYAPSREYNIKYSTGIKGSIVGYIKGYNQM